MKKTIQLNTDSGIQIPLHDARVLRLQYDKEKMILQCEGGLYIEGESTAENKYSVAINIKPEDINIYVSRRFKLFFEKYPRYNLKRVSLNNFQKQFQKQIVEIHEIYYGDSHCIILKCAVMINGKYNGRYVLMQFYTSENSLMEIDY